MGNTTGKWWWTCLSNNLKLVPWRASTLHFSEKRMRKKLKKGPNLRVRFFPLIIWKKVLKENVFRVTSVGSPFSYHQHYMPLALSKNHRKQIIVETYNWLMTFCANRSLVTLNDCKLRCAGKYDQNNQKENPHGVILRHKQHHIYSQKSILWICMNDIFASLCLLSVPRNQLNHELTIIPAARRCEPVSRWALGCGQWAR